VVRINRVYTRAGDKGQTALGGGQRVDKDSARIEAYGTVDELNSAIGVAISYGLDEGLASALRVIQQELFNLGSDLAILEADKKRLPVPQIESRHVEKLENLIDQLNEELEPLKSFIMPAGTAGAAQLHVARTICRRAERRTLSLSREEPLGPFVLPYLNRLSDALFVMARAENKAKQEPETLWDSRAF
jgi:cob(I)alamin adenosyltransferase